jgi:hypothetical protein
LITTIGTRIFSLHSLSYSYSYSYSFSHSLILSFAHTHSNNLIPFSFTHFKTKIFICVWTAFHFLDLLYSV